MWSMKMLKTNDNVTIFIYTLGKFHKNTNFSKVQDTTLNTLYTLQKW